METLNNQEPFQRFNPLDYGTASSSVCTKIQHSVAQLKSTVCVQRREGFSLSSVRRSTTFSSSKLAPVARTKVLAQFFAYSGFY